MGSVGNSVKSKSLNQGIKLLHLNIQCISNKINEFDAFLLENDNNFDIMFE